MFTKPRIQVGLSVISLLAMLAACSLYDLMQPPSPPMPVQPTPQSMTPLPGHFLGEANAPITVEEYVDFQCPPCRQLTLNMLPIVKEKYIQTGQIKWTLHHYPFIGEESTQAAIASECAADQGKFWEYVEVIYAHQSGENQGAFAQDKLIGFAQQLQLEPEDFKACLTDNRHLAEITASRETGKKRGVYGVPTLFFNGEMADRVLTLEQFEQHLSSLGQ